jgi:hypothetical protein
LEDSYRQQDCPLLEEDSSDDESDNISSSSDLDDSSRKEDIFGKSQLPTSLTSRSELLLPTTDVLIKETSNESSVTFKFYSNIFHYCYGDCIFR